MQVRFDGFRLDLHSRELFRSGRRVRLQEKPFLVLQALTAAPGKLVTRDELRTLLWPDGTVVDFDNNLNSAVASVRAALRDPARSPRLIETLPRLGYRFLGRVRVDHDHGDGDGNGDGRNREEARPPAELPAAAPPGRSERPLLPGRRLLAGLAAATLLTLVALSAIRPATEQAPKPAAEARSAWQRGLFLQERADPGDLELAVEAFDEVIALDPSFAQALAARAHARLDLGFRRRLALRESLSLAGTDARAALARNPELATAHATLAMVELHADWDLASAGRSIAEARRLDPDDPRIQLASAGWLSAVGRHDEAVQAARRAVELDPASFYVRADLGWFLLAAGRYEEAIVESESALAVEPDFVPALTFLVQSHVALGHDAEAVAAAHRVMALSGVEASAIEGTLAGPPAAALVAYRKWRLESARADESSHLQLARGYALLGENTEVLEQLALAVAAREPFLVYLRGFREFDTLRGDPRFSSVLGAIGG